MHKPKYQIIFPESEFLRAIRETCLNEYFIEPWPHSSIWIFMDDWINTRTGLRIRDYENPWTGGFYLIDEQKYVIAKLKYM